MAALAAENAPDDANTLDEYRDQAVRIGAALTDISSDIRVVRLLLIEAASADTDLRQRIDDMFDLAVQVNAASTNTVVSGYLRADLDTTATSRAVIGMIFGLAMIGLNPALDPDEKIKPSKPQSA